MSFLEALCHLFHPMVDDPLWLVMLRWLLVVTVMLVSGMTVVFAEASMLDRAVRWAERRSRRQRTSHRVEFRRVTFTTMFEG